MLIQLVNSFLVSFKSLSQFLLAFLQVMDFCLSFIKAGVECLHFFSQLFCIFPFSSVLPETAQPWTFCFSQPVPGGWCLTGHLLSLSGPLQSSQLLSYNCPPWRGLASLYRSLTAFSSWGLWKRLWAIRNTDGSFTSILLGDLLNCHRSLFCVSVLW